MGRGDFFNSHRTAMSVLSITSITRGLPKDMDRNGQDDDANILIFLTDKDEKLAKPQYRMNLILFENNMKHENTYNVR